VRHPTHVPRLALLVAGSQALAATPTATFWTRARIAEALDGVPPNTVVLVGRCPDAPDEWAADLAMARHLRVVEYDGVRGARYENSRLAGNWNQRWDVDWRKLDSGARLQERDRVLVQALVASRKKGWQVRVLALVAPWAKTHGTADVIAWAREVGIEVVERTCPTEMGPS